MARTGSLHSKTLALAPAPGSYLFCSGPGRKATASPDNALVLVTKRQKRRPEWVWATRDGNRVAGRAVGAAGRMISSLRSDEGGGAAGENF